MNQIDELLATYDKQGNSIDPLPRSVVHTKPVTHWHGVVNVWLVNRAGQLMVSKRAENVGGNPGKWQTYFGGHVPAGMSYLETAVKELQEEVGLDISADSLHFIDKGQFANEDHLHFYESYVYLFVGQPNDLDFTDNEISEAKWMDMEVYEAARAEHPEQWCNACNPDNQKRIKDWLSTLKQIKFTL